LQINTPNSPRRPHPLKGYWNLWLSATTIGILNELYD